jgi:hypothetical protein
MQSIIQNVQEPSAQTRVSPAPSFSKKLNKEKVLEKKIFVVKTAQSDHLAHMPTMTFS